MTPTPINHKSDFPLLIRLTDSGGNPVPFPECDWEAIFWTSSKAITYVAARRDGEFINCRPQSDGAVLFVFNSHRLPPGQLHWAFRPALPDELYPDGTCDINAPDDLNVELITGRSQFSFEQIEATLSAPYVKGDKGDAFTYADFTPQQIAELQRPATEAAESVAATEDDIKAAEALRLTAESARVSAESARAEAESLRAESEAERNKAEATRLAAEKQRSLAEAERIAAEGTRANQEKARVAAEQTRAIAEADRAAAEVSRENAEDSRVTAENKRATAEQSRADSETVRTTAESARVSAEASRVAAETKRASDFTKAEAQRQSTFESAEAERAQAETTRITNEQSRVNAEHTRASQETARQDAENARQSNEQSRVTAEGARVEAENARTIEFAGFAATIATKQDKITTSEDLSLSEENELSLTDMAKKRLFIDMWNAAAGNYGRYNEATGFFELNGLTDITYGQAIKIYDATYPARQLNDLSAAFAGMSFRTNLPVATFQKSEHGLRMQSAFRYTSGVEVINLDFEHGALQPALRIVGNPMWIFPNSQSLKKILGPITFIERVPAFNGWPHGLEDAQIHALSVDLDMRDCSRLTLASVKYIIDKAANTKTITITVHPDIYAKLTDENDTEWHKVMLDATEKNIQFVTV